MKHLLTVLIALFSLATMAQVEYVEYKEPATGDRAGIYVLQPKRFDTAISYRLIIGLPGIGERGNGSTADLEKVRTTGTWSTLKKRVKADGRYILVLVQPANEYENGETGKTYNWAKTKFGNIINWNKVYLTGLSLGGGGSQRFIAENPDADKMFAACAIVCPGDNQFFIKNANGYNNIEKYARTRPVWFLHAKNDPVVKPSQSTDITIAKIKALNPGAFVRRTLYKYEGHGAWVRAYGDNPAATPALAEDYNNPPGGVMEFFEANELGQPATFPASKSDSVHTPVTGTVSHAQPGYDSIDAVVSNFMNEQKIPGFAACVVKDKSIVWSKTYGKSDLGQDKPMGLDGIMNIGSISKTFTATCVMQLWERGRLDLNTDIGKYLGFAARNPKFPDKPITIQQLLTHTSSITDGKAYNASYACGDPTMSLHEWIYNVLTPEGKYYYSGNNYGDWPPGENKRKYSNIAFGVLGLIVEKVSKKPFNEYCKANIFKPLGMKSTGWYIREVDTSRYIRPYAYVTADNRKFLVEIKRLFYSDTSLAVGSYAPTCLYSFPNYPDGLVRTTVNELSLFLTAMINGGELNGKRILKKSTIDKMLSLQVEGDKVQGLTWRRFEPERLPHDIPLWGHSGSDPGITTYLVFNPVEKIGVITFQNNATGGTFEVVEKLYRAASN